MNLYTIPLSRSVKQVLLALADALMLALALWLCFTLLGIDTSRFGNEALAYFGIATLASVGVFYRIGLYRALLLYIGLQSAFIVLQGVTVATVITAAVYYLLLPGIEHDFAVIPIYWMLALLFIGGSRFVTKVTLQSMIQNFRPKEPVIIYGAGNSGMQLLAALQNGEQYLPVAFVDDGRGLIGRTLQGIRVYSPNSLPELIDTFSVRQILLAIPSATHAERKQILNRLEHLPVHVKTVPDMFDMVSGKAGVDQVREVEIEDLLGRDTIPPDRELLGACIASRAVMVTGAAGSIGSELCRQIVSQHPRYLILLDSFEYGLYSVESELREMLTGDAGGEQVEIVAVLGNVCDQNLMRTCMRRYAIQTVYHAAAYKQVPMVERNIVEGVRNNVFGTVVAAQVAAEAGVEDFVFISTDKAVRPTNVMGATKRFAEQVLQAMSATQSQPRFSMVRFGNVLGSSGSVVPLFRRQISAGGPVTVTHPEVTRYFMTVQEAAQLVIQAGSMASGGDVFVLDMNEPIRIVDLARKMIHLMGYDVRDETGWRGDIAIEYTGLRPGEKLFEELLIGESVSGTEHPKILRAREDSLSWESLEPMVRDLEQACKRLDLRAIRDILLSAVDGFPARDFSDDPLWQPAAQSIAEEQPGRAPAATTRTATSKVTPLHRKL